MKFVFSTFNKQSNNRIISIFQGWKYKIVANFVEIYNEEIRDLLATEKGLKHEIKRVDAKSNDIYVTNLKVNVQTIDITTD